MEIISGGWLLPDPKKLMIGTVVYDSATEDHYVVKKRTQDTEKVAAAKKAERVYRHLALTMFLLSFSPAIAIIVFMFPPFIHGQYDSINELMTISLPVIVPGIAALLLFAALGSWFNHKQSEASREFKKEKREYAYWDVYEETEETGEIDLALDSNRDILDNTGMIDGLPAA